VQWSSFAGYCTLSFERGDFLNPKLFFLALASPIFAATVYTDGTFNPANWQSTTLTQTGSAQLQISQLNANGNPGDFQQVSFSVLGTAAGDTAYVNIARFRSGFTWNPATDGTLGSMSFSMDLRNFSTAFNPPTALFWRPVLLQNGLTYSVLSSSLSPTPNGGFGTLAWNFTNQSNWVNFQNPALAPNFTSTGSLMTFGYRVESGTTCPSSAINGCRPVTVVDGLDNYRVELTAAQEASGVPEPSTWALGIAGLAALAIRQRHLKK
jgi:hypothetical protein